MGMALGKVARRSEVAQLTVFGVDEAPRDDEKAVFRDPAFAANKRLPFHRWVPWIAGFSSEFVQAALKRYLPKKGVVLDPFAGVGTTLVEAALAGHDAVGFEINPYAAFACRTKLGAFQADLGAFLTAISRFRDFYTEKMSATYHPRSSPPAGFRTRSPFYSPKVLHKVLVLQDFIATLPDNLIRDLFRLAFASTMVSYSNYSYEPSLGRRKSAGKNDIEDYPVAHAVLGKLREMAEDVAVLQSRPGSVVPRFRIWSESFFECRSKVPSGSVDLIVTSPPYVNNYHYNRNTRPHVYWLGYVKRPQDMMCLEDANFGKFWQTVREHTCIDLDFEADGLGIQEQLEELRKMHPEKGVYGGNGWANYAASYFNDCYRFAKCMRQVLKPKGTALVVIGNSILQGVMIPTDRYFAEIAGLVGLELVGIDVPRATRVGNSIIQSEVRVARAQESHQLYEAVVELREP